MGTRIGLDSDSDFDLVEAIRAARLERVSVYFTSAYGPAVPFVVGVSAIYTVWSPNYAPTVPLYCTSPQRRENRAPVLLLLQYRPRWYGVGPIIWKVPFDFRRASISSNFVVCCFTYIEHIPAPKSF